MKKVLLVFCLFLPATKIFAQQFSQYNTGSLYDSFENPSQRAFVLDSSKKYATNYLIPNASINAFLTGDGQATLKNRLFLNQYDNSQLLINQGRYNLVRTNVNAYLFMFKWAANVQGEEEIGFSWQFKQEGNGRFTDESLAALNGTSSFTDGNLYNSIFNDNYYYQYYHQVSFSYRERFNKQLTFGIKLSALFGIEYQKLNIANSQAVFDNLDQSVTVGLQGQYYKSYVPGQFVNRDFLPTFRNPGASITFGATYTTEDNFVIQGNIKDLGFIHWSGYSEIYNFNNSTTIANLASPSRENTIYNSLKTLVQNSPVEGSFTSNTDGRAELSVHHGFYMDEDNLFEYLPTLVASKELFNNGFTGGLVNRFKYRNFSVAATTTYDDLKDFNLGLQLMLQKPNWEVFIGTDKLMQTVSLASQAATKNSASIDQNPPYTGGNFFIGFSMKFGPVAEHPMDASSIPLGEKGFLGRLFGRLFKTYE